MAAQEGEQGGAWHEENEEIWRVPPKGVGGGIAHLALPLGRVLARVAPELLALSAVTDESDGIPLLEGEQVERVGGIEVTKRLCGRGR